MINVGERLVHDLAPGVSDTEVVTDYNRSWHLRVGIEASDALACRLKRIEIRRATADRLTDSRLGLNAQRFAESVIYLLEPLRVSEVDTTTKRAMIRSFPPATSGHWRAYFQAILEPDRIVLERWKYWSQAGQKEDRLEAIGFDFTREVLVGLIDDLVMALAS